MTDKELDYSKIILELQKINNLDKEKKLIQLDKLIEEIKNTDIIIDDSIYEYIQETKEVIEYKLNYKNELNILESKRETYVSLYYHMFLF
jgi:chorismate mutase